MLNLKIESIQRGVISVLGVPFDHNSSYMHGPAGAPSSIRNAFHSESANLFTENGLDLGANLKWRDMGDLIPSNHSTYFGEIRETISLLLAKDVRIVALGGDHSITYPIIQAYAQTYPGLNILQIDAHPDLYDELDGNRLSHACPFARIMEEELVTHLTQVGIRTMTLHQRRQGERFGVEVNEMRRWRPDRIFKFDGPVYISLDMDALDPAYAPGVSHHEPGGFTTRDVLSIIQGLKAQVVGADVVELNPKRDINGVTAMVAAKILKEILARMLE